MKHAPLVLLSRSWLVAGLLAAFTLSAGTAIVTHVFSHDLASSSKRLSRQLEQLEPSPIATVPHLASEYALLARRAEFFERTSITLFLLACLTAAAGAWLVVRRVQEQHRSLLTVCAWTKRVKVDGTWISIEDYLHDRFDLQLTHGICEEAASKLRRENDAHMNANPSTPRGSAA